LCNAESQTNDKKRNVIQMKGRRSLPNDRVKNTEKISRKTSKISLSLIKAYHACKTTSAMTERA
jgi:hypothetical protein